MTVIIFDSLYHVFSPVQIWIVSLWYMDFLFISWRVGVYFYAIIDNLYEMLWQIADVLQFSMTVKYVSSFILDTLIHKDSVIIFNHFCHVSVMDSFSLIHGFSYNWLGMGCISMLSLTTCILWQITEVIQFFMIIKLIFNFMLSILFHNDFVIISDDFCCASCPVQIWKVSP